MRFRHLALALVAVLLVVPQARVEADELDRTKLPIQAPKRPPITEVDARKAKAPPPFRIDAPKGAPNIVIVLIDDIGFGTANCFGGGIETPTLDRLAKGGLRYNQFHTTALCSPTRMALLTGRNHHSANAGSVMEVATAFRATRACARRASSPYAEMLRLNGYSTAAFGKWHETAPWEVSVSGPYDRWPTRSGFDKFYGFIGGETNQWAPVLHDGTTPRRAADDPDYHFTTDLADEGDRVGALPAVADARQAVLRLLRDRRDARAAPRPTGVDRQVRRQVRRRMGRRIVSRRSHGRSSMGVVPAGTQASAQA